MSDRFDLEQSIMECWNVVEDIDLLYTNVLDNPKFDMQPETADRVANLLLGMKELYELRFERLWKHFEGCIEKGSRGLK